MNKEDIKKLAENPDFIESVHNYCDRWCEHCRFTSRCMNYAMSEEQFPDDESRDIKNEIFWKKLSETFKVTFELLKEAAAEHGIDLDKIEVTEDDKQEREIEREIQRQNLCARESNIYIDIARKWLEEHHLVFEEKEDELNSKLSMGIEKNMLHKEAEEIRDAIEIIQWYLFFIHVKIMRALHGKRDDEYDDNEFPKDSDGSAKIALIATDRSMSAWLILLKYFPQEEDSILNILSLLDKIRRLTEQEFPAARAFKRPGFDKED
ncbi:MAG: hypothetical protein WC868_11410 [Bacteroidales bacterium]